MSLLLQCCVLIAWLACVVTPCLAVFISLGFRNYCGLFFTPFECVCKVSSSYQLYFFMEHSLCSQNINVFHVCDYLYIIFLVQYHTLYLPSSLYIFLHFLCKHNAPLPPLTDTYSHTHTHHPPPPTHTRKHTQHIAFINCTGSGYQRRVTVGKEEGGGRGLPETAS